MSDEVRVENIESTLDSQKPPLHEVDTKDNGSKIHYIEQDPSEQGQAKRQKTLSLVDQVREQLEFYFSEANYPRDKWMNITAAENDGYIPLESFSKFQRIAKLLEGSDSQVIVEAIETSSELTLSDDKKKVKRSTPIPDNIDIDQKTVVVKKLPKDDSIVNIDSVKKFFNAYAPVLAVRIHKKADKSGLSGVAFVTFRSVQDKDNVLKLENLHWDSEHQLQMENKKDSDEAFRERRKKAKELRERAEDLNAGETCIENNKDSQSFEKGLILKLTKFADAKFEEIKEIFSEFGKIKFVDIFGGPNSTRCEETHSLESKDSEQVTPIAYVRFSDVEMAKKAEEKVSNKQINSKDVTFEGFLLEGEEEENYWKENIIGKNKNNSKSNKNNHRKGRNKSRKNRF